MGLGHSKFKAAHSVNIFLDYLGKNIKNCPPSKLFLFTSLVDIVNYIQGNLKGESVVAAILLSGMEASYCPSRFFFVAKLAKQFRKA